MPHAATNFTMDLISRNSPQPTLFLVRMLNTGIASPDPLQGFRWQNCPSFRHNTPGTGSALRSTVSWMCLSCFGEFLLGKLLLGIVPVRLHRKTLHLAHSAAEPPCSLMLLRALHSALLQPLPPPHILEDTLVRAPADHL